MRRLIIILFLIGGMLIYAFNAVESFTVRIASDEDIKMLKLHLLERKLRVGKTRLSEIREKYGDPSDISESDRKVTLNYGDIKIDFEKIRYWIDWERDSSYSAVYTDDVDDLRYDLEARELVGDNITYKDILSDYGLPTVSIPSEDDGALSVYYYGNIKMIFENHIVLKSWKGQRLYEQKKKSGDVLLQSSQPDE